MLSLSTEKSFVIAKCAVVHFQPLAKNTPGSRPVPHPGCQNASCGVVIQASEGKVTCRGTLQNSAHAGKSLYTCPSAVQCIWNALWFFH